MGKKKKKRIFTKEEDEEFVKWLVGEIIKDMYAARWLAISEAVKKEFLTIK